MVYLGPSRGCATCRKRRIKCDERRPECFHCQKRRQACPGYRDVFDVMLKDQTVSVPAKARKKQAALDRRRAQMGYKSPPECELFVADRYQSMSVDAEMSALCFFFTSYVTIRRDPLLSRGFLEHLLPAYSQVNHDSPMSHATSSVALQLAALWSGCGSDTPLEQAFFAKALKSVKAAISDPVQSLTDATLLTVLLLGFQDSLRSRFLNGASSGTHESGAVALVKHRGSRNFTSEHSKHLLTAVRSQIIATAVQKNREVIYDPDIWTDGGEMPQNPAIQIDKYAAELADLQALQSSTRTSGCTSANSRSRSPVAVEGLSSVKSRFTRAVDLDARMVQWPNTIPSYWLPNPVTIEDIPPTIVAAGIYRTTCDVYPSVHVAHIYNLYRCTRLSTLKIILQCCDQMVDFEITGGAEKYARSQIQQLVDGLCASIPFFLGDRIEPVPPEKFNEVQYPELLIRKVDPDAPHELVIQNTQREHKQAAAAMGGWFLLASLRTVFYILQYQSADDGHPLLRPGQMAWLGGQFKRMGRIYLIPQISLG